MAQASGGERSITGRPGYQDLLDRLILPTFGHHFVHTISRDLVDNWYDRLPSHTPVYKARAYALVRAILMSAVDEGHLITNPARIRGAGYAPRRHQVRIATVEEVEAIAAAMPSRYRLMPQLATYLALRFGEVSELRRGDIDTKRGVVKIRRAVVHVDGKFIVKPPKSEAGTRDLVIPPHLMPAVLKHLLQYCAPGGNGLLFPSKDDQAVHLRQSALTWLYYPARQAAGRPDLRFHDLRHTGGTWFAQAGGTLAETMTFMGHSTVQAAMRYQHAAQGRDAVFAQRFSDMYEEAMGAKKG